MAPGELILAFSFYSQNFSQKENDVQRNNPESGPNEQGNLICFVSFQWLPMPTWTDWEWSSSNEFWHFFYTGNFPVLICDVSHSAQMCSKWVLNGATCNYQVQPMIGRHFFHPSSVNCLFLTWSHGAGELGCTCHYDWNCLFPEDGWWESHFICYYDTPWELPGQHTKLSITVCYGFSIFQYTNDISAREKMILAE